MADFMQITSTVAMYFHHMSYQRETLFKLVNIQYRKWLTFEIVLDRPLNICHTI